MDTNVNTDANINQAVWNAISRRLVLGLGTLLQQASTTQRREYAIALFELYTKDTPALWRPATHGKLSVQELIEQSGDDISVEAFDRLIEEPASEIIENKSLKAILPAILKVEKKVLFTPVSHLAQQHTVSKRKQTVSISHISTKPQNTQRSKKDWALLFAKKFPELWSALSQKYNDQNSDASQDEEIIYKWLETETARKANVAQVSIERTFTTLIDGSANQGTLDKYMQTLYGIASVELPEIYATKRPIRRTPQEWADEFAKNLPDLWNALSDRYKETFPDRVFDDISLYKWIETTLSQKASSPPSNVENILKGFIKSGLKDGKSNRYVPILFAMADLPVPPFVNRELSSPKATL